ncbi:tyrosine-type recombinase/integrase [Comamonas terrigena]|uniref:tyrosine-type recombinase/integrase n=1 Tax=Comamonas terrigena TaxID=32013 RepID=UPI00289951B5|nr:hypothetical protein [Comamonas terrigena]
MTLNTFNAHFDAVGAEAPTDKPFIELKHVSQPGFLVRITKPNKNGVVTRYWVARYKELQPDGSQKDRKETIGTTADMPYREAIERVRDLLSSSRKNTQQGRHSMTVKTAAEHMLAALDSPAALESEQYKLKLRTAYRNYIQKYDERTLDSLKEPFWKKVRDQLRTGEGTVKNQPLATATVEGIFSCVSRLYAIAHEHRGILEEPAGWNPVLAAKNSMEPANKRKTFIPLELLGKAWTASDVLCAPGWRDMFRVYLLTGLRDSLLVNLTWDKVRVNSQGQCSLFFKVLEEGTKARKASIAENEQSGEYEIPVSSAVHDILRRRSAFRPAGNDYVFFAEGSGDKVRRGSERIVDPRKAWESIERVVGMHISKHDLRRTFASLAATIAGESMVHVSLLMMHSNKSIASAINTPVITMDYVQGQLHKMRAVTEKVSNALLELAGERPKSELTHGLTAYTVDSSFLRELGAEVPNIAYREQTKKAVQDTSFRIIE